VIRANKAADPPVVTQPTSRGRVLQGPPAPVPHDGQRRRRRRAGQPAMSLAAPAIVVAVAFSIVFLGYTAWIITHRYDLLSIGHPFIGGAYFRDLIADATLRSSLLVTLKYTIAALVVEVALGLAIAILIHHGVRGKVLVRSLVLIPMVATPLVVGLMWRLMYDPSAGLLAGILRGLGLNASRAYLADPHTALAAVTVVDIWQWTPFIIIILLAALEALPREPFEAAQVDGVNRWQELRYFTIPMLRPAIAVAALLRFMGLVQSFAVLYATTNGGPGTSTLIFNVFDYQKGFTALHLGYATTVGFCYALAATLLITPVARRLLGLRKGAAQ
jgi:multiple sugar transport system permease protein